FGRQHVLHLEHRGSVWIDDPRSARHESECSEGILTFGGVAASNVHRQFLLSGGLIKRGQSVSKPHNPCKAFISFQAVQIRARPSWPGFSARSSLIVTSCRLTRKRRGGSNPSGPDICPPCPHN